MTIKRRLFISNILMIVIPVLISLLIIFVGGEIIFRASQDSVQKDNQFFDSRGDLIQRAKQFLENGNEQKRDKNKAALEKILEKNELSLDIYSSEKSLFSFGTLHSQYSGELTKAIWALHGEGSASLKNEEVYAEKMNVNGTTYTVIIYNIISDYNYDEVPPEIIILGILFFVGTIAAIVLTNRFLTRFVFKRIKQPLDTLVDGVHQLRDGNLDVRIRYENKDEFASVCEDFNDMAVRLKESVQLIQKQEENRKELLAGISHDLRSPLTSVRAYSEGLLDGVAQTRESQINYIRMIKTKAEDIDRMVAKIFLFSKMDLGDYPYDPEALEVNQEILSLVKATAEEYRENGLEVSVTALAADHVLIFADPVQLNSIFTNLLENSLKYKIKEQGHVSIRTEVKGNEVLIYVDDDGPGVPVEALDKLFDVFYRSDPSRKNPNKGSGLGLAITAKAVDRMGGSIHAEPSPAGGLCMVIKLPVLSKGAIA
ncbi:sensor histidine kinase [Paenibacillus sp. HW567]|uniref:sensor histidine kinase n=1 Tax=Paenibacillus sp. HW567 TaxID=1034769 RepID=UPI000365C111|nr:ATP-binding protein [Paenibacillus sp. HW567]